MKKERKLIYKEISAAIKAADSILIASHEDPDGDSLGSMLSLRRIILRSKKKATAVKQGIIPYKYKSLPDIEKILDVDEHPGIKYDLAFILECPQIERAGKVKNFIDSNTFLINIDHHPDNRLFGRINYIDDTASSVGEMLYEYFVAEKLEIDKETAAALYAAILTDTGRFRFDSTSPRTMQIAGELISRGVNPRQITDKIYFGLPPSILKATGRALSSIDFYENGRICILQLDKQILKEAGATVGEMEGLADYALYAQGVVVGGLLKEIEDSYTKVSLRSRDGVDVSRLAHKYGGGGHKNAAGYGVEMPLEEARRRLIEDLKELIHDAV
jgi:phosphoesterase RecJ-like protein